MKKLFIIGAGRSASSLIQYAATFCREKQWELTVGDISAEMAREKLADFPEGRAIAFNVMDEGERNAEIAKADLVISMLPARFHHLVAESCLRNAVHLLTASYVSEEIKALDAEAREKGLLFLMECGLDPGLDHMSAMRVIDRIRRNGWDLIGFETFTGGLITPESCEENPWEYKFTWNPRNVVLAGQGMVKFIQEGRYKYIPYHRLFRRTEVIHIPGHGYFEGYANRDSLKYLDVYQLRRIRTLYRGTLRRPGYCKSWDIFVQLGATEDSYEMEGVAQMSHKQFINSFLSFDPHNSVELKLAHYLGLDLDSQEMFRMRWLGLFDDELIGLEKGTPAQILEHILKKKWTLLPDDLDMIVMWHKFDFMDGDKHRQIQSHMVSIGHDAEHTGMSRTVGLPMGIAAKLILEDRIGVRGVQIPVIGEIYEPILNELEGLGIELEEREVKPENEG